VRGKPPLTEQARRVGRINCVPEGQTPIDGASAARGKDQLRARGARSLRSALPRAEAVLWKRIRNRQLKGFKFVRQEPIGLYYVDFVCRERQLVVELDGGQHAESAIDQQSDHDLTVLGYRVIRIWDDDIFANLEGVLQTLLSELEK
jgi:very-short-patch-repair endonuclease